MKRISVIHKLIGFLFVAFLLPCCVSTKDITYFQGIDKMEPDSIKNSFTAVIKTGDILSINVVSLSPEANQFFSFQQDKNQGNTSSKSIGYLVDAEGQIQMPLIGKIKISGLTTTIAADSVRNRLEKYLERPTVLMRYENYRITILGEVARPGIHIVQNEKISILEALGMAGDITIYGKRKNVMVIREDNGKRTVTRLDLTSPDVFNSPCFYLQSSDLVYVDPGKGKVAMSDNFYRVVPLVFSSITFLFLISGRFF